MLYNSFIVGTGLEREQVSGFLVLTFLPLLHAFFFFFLEQTTHIFMMTNNMVKFPRSKP